MKDEGHSANSASGPTKMEITNTMELNTKKELTSKPDSNLSSSYEEISNQDPNFDESSNQDLHVEQTTNQSESKVDTNDTNENTYFDESANQEAYSEQIDESSHQAQEDMRDEDYGGMEGKEEEGMNEEEKEEEEEEEDTSFCHYCKVPFDSDEVSILQAILKVLIHISNKYSSNQNLRDILITFKILLKTCTCIKKNLYTRQVKMMSESEVFKNDIFIMNLIDSL